MCARQDGSKESHHWAKERVFWSHVPSWVGARILQSRNHRWQIICFRVRPPHSLPLKSGVVHYKLVAPNNAIMSKSKTKSFFTVRGSSRRNLCLQDKLSIKRLYREVLERLRKSVVHVRIGTATTVSYTHLALTKLSVKNAGCFCRSSVMRHNLIDINDNRSGVITGSLPLRNKWTFIKPFKSSTRSAANHPSVYIRDQTHINKH